MSAPATPAQEREPDSGSLLVRTFARLRHELHIRLFAILRNEADTQDAVQTTFLKCWQERARLPGVRDVRGWILRVSFNAAKDYLRSGWRRRARPLEAAGSPSTAQLSPPDNAILREDLQRLDEAVSALPPEQRDVLLLHRNNGLTFEEIARVRHSPVGTVKSQARAALDKLRRWLREGRIEIQNQFRRPSHAGRRSA
jgi:RNA polymerase sigma-70 factor (ECF subfamily)